MEGKLTFKPVEEGKTHRDTDHFVAAVLREDLGEHLFHRVNLGGVCRANDDDEFSGRLGHV